MVRFSLFGIPVEIQPFFWISLVLIGYLGFSDAADAQGLLILALFVLAGFLSILVHELGHAGTGRLFGAPTQITLQAFGGFASFPPGSFTRGQDILVTAAGPLVQIALGIVALLVWREVRPETQAELASAPVGIYFVYFLFLISIFWALLNLIPVFPLDGGRLLVSILGPRREATSLTISMVVAIAAGIGMFLWMHSFIFPIFLGMMAYQNWQALQNFRR